MKRLYRGGRLLFTCMALWLGLSAFDSYKHPFEQVLRDPKLQAEIERELKAGNKTVLYAGHYLITQECLSRAGVFPAVVEPMSDKVSDIDLDNWKNRKHYEAKNHCDRPMGVSHRDAFTAALRYHRERVAEAWNSLTHGDLPRVVKILPRALHVQQDFFSHSNFVDPVFDADRSAVIQCWTTYATPRAGRPRIDNENAIAGDARCIADDPAWSSHLKITGFDFKAQDWAAPPNDPYPHRTYAKDNANYSPEAQSKLDDGRTKYVAAREAAFETCVLSIREFSRICLADDLCRPHHGKVFAPR